MLLYIDPFPPPTNIRLLSVSSRQITFMWDAPMTMCEVLYYIINATNCGTCPKTSNSTTIICTDFEGYLSTPQLCRMTIQTVVCNNIVGSQSNEVLVTLQGIILYPIDLPHPVAPPLLF